MVRRPDLSPWRHRWRRAAAAAILAAAAGATGCALKNPPPASELRDQTLSHAPLPEKWSANIVTEGAVQDGWVNSFNDPALKSLVAEALEHNTDLRAAAARVEQAAGYARAAGAAIYPAVNLLARGGGPMSGDGSGLEGAWLSASWELDLWGRVRAVRAAGAAQYESTEADYIYARQALAAAVTKSWFLAIEAQLQRSIAEEMVVAGERLVDIARERQRVGADDEYNVVVAEASLGGFRDTLLQLEFAYQQAVRALEILLGRYPAATMKTPEQLPALPPPIPAGLPSELLERRPDVVAAERRVAAAFYGVSEAKAARLPKISLSASVSTISSELFVLQDRDDPVWSAGASLLAPIFQGGALQAQVEIRTAEQKQALADYARIGLRAFNEAETAMYGELMLRSREQVLTKAVADNKRALELAEVRYRVGATDLRAVSQQQLDLLSVQTTLLRVRSEARVQRVNLHLALGGSFDIPSRVETSPPEKSASNAGAANHQ
jgi:NodT family efflux transporter outer membrane factor (OMF) lipoprotein